MDAAVQQLLITALQAGIELTADDFEYDDGELTLDGMPAAQWLEAMTWS